MALFTEKDYNLEQGKYKSLIASFNFYHPLHKPSDQTKRWIIHQLKSDSDAMFDLCTKVFKWKPIKTIFAWINFFNWKHHFMFESCILQILSSGLLPLLSTWISASLLSQNMIQSHVK